MKHSYLNMESEAIDPKVKQSFTWSTPFFDVTFVDIKSKKGKNKEILFSLFSIPLFCHIQKNLLSLLFVIESSIPA